MGGQELEMPPSLVIYSSCSCTSGQNAVRRTNRSRIIRRAFPQIVLRASVQPNQGACDAIVDVSDRNQSTDCTVRKMWEQRDLNRSEGASIVMRLEVRLSDMQPATIQNVDESEGVILSH